MAEEDLSKMAAMNEEPGPRQATFEGTGTGFYRCVYCHTVVSPWDIKKGGCPHCGGTRIVPANLRWWEKVLQIIKHPALWRWNDEG